MWAAFANGMSVLSGESQLKGSNPMEQAFNLATGGSKSDAQKTREGRFGSPKLPFTDISMTVQTPFGEVNAARFMPWYSLNDIGGDITKFLPISQSPVVIQDGKPALNGGGFADPLLGQLVQLAIDKDFSNKSIYDPQNTGQFSLAPLTDQQRMQNALRFILTQNAPLGKEADSLISASTNQPDAYGKTRNLPQAIARAMGVKVEQFGQKQVDNLKSTEAYFAEKDQLDKELAMMTPAAQAAYKRLTGYDKLRERVTNEFDPTTTRYKKAPVYNFSEDKWKDYAQNPEIYKLMMKKKQQASITPNQDGKTPPLQPEFDSRLSESFRNQLIQNKMVAPGDDAELDQRMYSSPEWDYYQKLKDEYKVQADAYYPKGDPNAQVVDELVKHQDAKFPDKPDVLKAYGEAYGLYTAGKSVKPEFTDAVKAAKQEYNVATFNWTNAERAARNLPAITWDMWNNPTYGYDSTPSSSYGYGSGGGNYINNLDPLYQIGSSAGGSLDTIKPKDMPNLVAILQKVMAASPSSRAKPTLGASSKGQG